MVYTNKFYQPIDYICLQIIKFNQKQLYHYFEGSLSNGLCPTEIQTLLIRY
jgi:hypothetical protein